MATMDPTTTRTFIAGADLSAQQYRMLRRTATADQCLVAQAGAANFAGVLLNAPTSGRAATVVTTGRTKVVAGEAFSLPAKVTSDASGRAVVADTAADYVVGAALEAASGAGQIIEIDLDLGGGHVLP